MRDSHARDLGSVFFNQSADLSLSRAHAERSNDDTILRMKLLDKLAQLMPKRPEPENDTMLRIYPEPIRRSAEAFARKLDYDLPANRKELIALLWCFGEVLTGHMEQRMDYQQKLIEDVVLHQVSPPIFIPADANYTKTS